MKIIEKIVKFMIMLALIIVGASVAGSTVKAASKDINSVIIIQAYVKVDSSGNNPVPVVMLYDNKILTENTDYTLELLDEDDPEYDVDFEYTFLISGLGNYSGECYYSTDYYGIEKSGYEIKYLENKDTDERFVISYIGNKKEVDFGKINDSIEIDEVFAGVFCDNDTIETISLGENCLTDYLCINCPNVVLIKTDIDFGLTVNDDTPGPIVAGNINDNVEVDVPINYAWSYNEDEGSMTIEEYCSKYSSYVVADSSDIYQTADGWSYRIDDGRNEAFIVSYKGSMTDVIVPQKVVYDNGNGEKEYEIFELSQYTFNGLSNLKSVDMGYIPLTDSLFKDCPKLEKVISRNRDDIELTGSLVDGNAPKDNTLTVSTYPDVVWELDDGDDDDETFIKYTIQEYCDDQKYIFEALEADYINFTVKAASSYVISGNSGQLLVYCEKQDNEEEEYVVTEIDAGTIISEWEIISGDKNSVSISDDGIISVSNKITEKTDINVKCIVKFKGEKIKASGVVSIYPKLVGTNSIVMVAGNPKILSCLQYVYSTDSDYPIVSSLPADVAVTYTVDNENVVNIDGEGIVSIADNAKEGDNVKVKAVYTIDGKDYTYYYYITVGKAQDISDVDTDKIYVYGWSYSYFDSVIDEFKSLYPSLRDSIEFITVTVSDEGDEWEDYRKIIDEKMKSEEKTPDIIIWPEDRLYENLSAEYLVELDEIGFDLQKDYANAFPYTKIKGTWNDKLYAVTPEINPGCFIYRKDLAKEVLGSDDEAVVQNAIKDWDSFLTTAELFKEKKYYITNSMNLNYPLFGGKSEPWIVDNVLNLEKLPKQYIELQKQMYVNGYIQEDSIKWVDPITYHSESFNNNSFGYFVDYRFLNDKDYISSIGKDYGICCGPANYENPDCTYITVTNTGHNNSLVKLLLQELVSNITIMKNSMDNGNGLMNNVEGLRTVAESDPIFNTLYGAASAINNVESGLYDFGIEDLLFNEYCIESWLDDNTNMTVSNVEKINMDTLFTRIKRDLTEILPDTITIDRIAENNSENNDPENNDPGNGDPQNDNPKNNDPENDNPKKDDVEKDDSGKEGQDKQDTGNGNTGSVEAASAHTHQYSDWVVVKEPMCDTAGLKQRTCPVCGDVETVEIPATGFVKNGSFAKNNIVYKVLTVKGKKGTIAINSIGVNTSNVKIPASIKAGGITFTVTAIADNAFKGNTFLKSVTIPKSITKIGKSAFEYCKKLKSVTIKTTKLTKKSIGKKAFKNVNSKVKFKCPKKKLANYKKWIKKAGAPKKAKYTK